MSKSDEMKQLLIKHFWGKPVLAAELEALGEELDEITAELDRLREERWIETGIGKQLDGIGEIVGRDRIIANAISLPFFGFYGQPNALGFEVGRFRDSGEAWQAATVLQDPEYRLILWAKVFKNITQGTAEDTIKSLTYIFQIDTVVVEDAGNAKIMLGIGRYLTAAELVMVKAYNLFIRAGGVGMKWAVMYNKDNYFGFLGQKNAKTFDVGEFADMVDLG